MRDAEELVHPTAVVHSDAKLGEGVRIGPFAIVSEQVSIGRNTVIDAHAVIRPFVDMGEDNRIFPFAIVGEVPQHVGFKGEVTRLVIGSRNKFREFVTIHRGTIEGGGVTSIGDDCLFMAYAHVAHDCSIGSGVIIANAVQMGGHVSIDDHAVVGGLSAIHQFVRVGRHSMVGGASGVTHDVSPYTTVAGNRAVLHGLNLIGLKRREFDAGSLSSLKKAYRIIFRRGLMFSEAKEIVQNEIQGSREVDHLVVFIESSRRGVCR